MTAPDRMPEAFENSLHDAGHPHMEPPANPKRFIAPLQPTVVPREPGRTFRVYELLLVGVHKRTRTMAQQIVMDVTGDTRHEFDPTDAAALAAASARFTQLTGAGFTAAVRTGSGTSELVRHFDPTADETVFFPQLRGG
jgi:hypothetical protein